MLGVISTTKNPVAQEKWSSSGVSGVSPEEFSKLQHTVAEKLRKLQKLCYIFL